MVKPSHKRPHEGTKPLPSGSGLQLGVDVLKEANSTVWCAEGEPHGLCVPGTPQSSLMTPSDPRSYRDPTKTELNLITLKTICPFTHIPFPEYSRIYRRGKILHSRFWISYLTAVGSSRAVLYTEWVRLETQTWHSSVTRGQFRVMDATAHATAQGRPQSDKWQHLPRKCRNHPAAFLPT